MHQLFYEGGSCRIETSLLICSETKTGFCIIEFSIVKDSRRSSSTYTESLFSHVVNHNLLFFFSFFSIWLFFHEYCRFTGQQVKRETISLYPFYHSTRFTGTQTLAGSLLQRAHLCAQLAAGIEHGIFGTSSLELTLSTLALVAAVIRRILKTRVTLGNVPY